jgi:hypothetical protein
VEAGWATAEAAWQVVAAMESIPVIYRLGRAWRNLFKGQQTMTIGREPYP